MMRLFVLLLLTAACAHQQDSSVVDVAVAVDAVSVRVDGGTFYGAAVSRYDPATSLLWYSLIYTEAPPDIDQIRRAYISQLRFANGNGKVVAFQLSGRSLFVLPDTIRAASVEAAREELLGTIAPRKLASVYPVVPVLPDDTITIDIYDALGHDFADDTFHERPATAIVSIRFADGAWRIEIRNGDGEIRELRLAPDFRPLNGPIATSELAILFVEGRYLDPSYGLEYKNESDFETKALDGYFTANIPLSLRRRALSCWRARKDWAHGSGKRPNPTNEIRKHPLPTRNHLLCVCGHNFQTRRTPSVRDSNYVVRWQTLGRGVRA